MQDSLKTSQVITAALIGGVVVFTAVFMFIGAEPTEEPLISWLAIGFVVLAVVGHQIVPVLVTPGPPDGQKYFIRSLFRAAILEGAALFNGVAYLLEGQTLNLAAIGVLVGLMLIGFPTRTKFATYIGDETL
ncbi:MAG: hypothetical protein AAGD32_09450 [Planctomycetota bacterium]